MWNVRVPYTRDESAGCCPCPAVLFHHHSVDLSSVSGRALLEAVDCNVLPTVTLSHASPEDPSIHFATVSCNVSSRKVNVSSYCASSRSASNAQRLSVHRRWSPQTRPPARHQRTLRDRGYGLVYHAICLFTLPAFAGYSFQPNHRKRVQAK